MYALFSLGVMFHCCFEQVCGLLRAEIKAGWICFRLEVQKKKRKRCLLLWDFYYVFLRFTYIPLKYILLRYNNILLNMSKSTFTIIIQYFQPNSLFFWFCFKMNSLREGLTFKYITKYVNTSKDM